MSADYTPALWMPTTHHGGWPFAPRYIILHGTAGGSSAQGIASYFQTNDPPTSTHYVVGVDGTVAQCVSESEAAWGNGVLSAGHDPWWSGNPNAVTFSIEHCKPHTDNSDALSPAQREASFALVKHLCDKYNIPRGKADASGGITSHASIDPVNRTFCPGPYPWADLFAYLNGGNSSMAWHRQPDKTGRDDRSHSCGEGIMNVLALRPDLASADGLMNERYRGGNDSVLPLANGHSITAHHDPVTGQWRVQQDDAGGLALMAGIIADLDAKVSATQTNQDAYQAVQQARLILDRVK